MRINGTEYGLRLTVAAAIEAEKVCPDQDITKIGTLLKGNADEAVWNVIRIVKILSDGYANSERQKGRAATAANMDELIDACAGELVFSHMVEGITETFERDYAGKISAKPTKKGREVAKKSIKRTLEGSLPWYLYFGRNHGMDKEDVLNTVFGEFQDLMTCDAISHGLAEEVAKKKKLTQEEMYELE